VPFVSCVHACMHACARACVRVSTMGLTLVVVGPLESCRNSSPSPYTHPCIRMVKKNVRSAFVRARILTRLCTTTKIDVEPTTAECALEELTAVLQHEPDHVDAMEAQAQLLSRLGRDEEVLEVTARALEV